MGFLKSLALAFSCFSKVPVPQLEWSDSNMRYMMACFPLVGIVSGALVALWCWFANVVGMGPVLFAVGVTLLPLAVSGGIHLDGFADVVDALSSHAPVGRRREILKDPHIGAFAAIGVAAYLVCYLGVASELPTSWQAVAILACIQVVVRCESGFATVLFGGSTGEGMLASFRESSEKRITVALICAEYAIVGCVMIVISPACGIAALAGGLLCLALLRPFAQRNFGGMSGDVAGFFLQSCELVMLVCLLVAAKVVGL